VLKGNGIGQMVGEEGKDEGVDECLISRMAPVGAGRTRGVPPSMHLLFPPPYSPERNPAEHPGEHLRENFFAILDDVQL